jgi:hypothetical protein
VDLAVAGGEIGRDQGFRLRHRLIRGKLAPWIGAEMIAAREAFARVEADAGGDRLDQRRERKRRHPDVAAFLVDRVAGALDRRLSAASMTLGWEEQIDGIPASSPARPRSGTSAKALVMSAIPDWR